MANFWDNDPVEAEPWEADPVVDLNPAKKSVEAPIEAPSYLDALKERTADLGDSLMHLPGEVKNLVGPTAREMGAGINRAGYDLLAKSKDYQARRLRDLSIPELREGGNTPADVASEEAFNAEMKSGAAGRVARRANLEQQEAIRPEAGPLESAAAQGLSSAAISAPAILAAGPVMGSALLGAGTGGQRYTQLLDKGVPQAAAAKSALMMGSLEGLTEFLPGQALVKNVPGFWKHLGEFMVAELPGENINSVAQLIDDYRLQLRDDVTKDDLLKAIEDTTLQTIIAGGAQTGAAHLLQQSVDKANQAKPAAGKTPQFTMPEPVVPEPAPLSLPAPGATWTPPDADFVVDAAGNAAPPGEQQKALPHLPEAPTGQFEAGQEGVRQLTTPEVSAREQEEERRQSLGLGNVERVPGSEPVSRGTSPQETTDLSALQAAKDGTATPEQLAGLKGFVNGSGQILPAGRRALKSAQTEQVNAAATLAGPKARITVKPREGRWVVAMDGEEQVVVDSEALARDIAKEARQHLSGPVEVLGQQVEHPTDPTEGQKDAGNYKKPTINFAGMEIAIENLTGSTRQGKDASGKPWSRVMRAPYGYVKRTEGADGDPVDVYLGKNPQSDSVYVIDQLSPNGKAFDEHKAVIGVNNQQEAEALYLKHYPAGWKGMGAVTPMPVAKFKEWARSGNTKAPVTWKDPALLPKRSTKTPQAQHDSILEFISKTKLHSAEKNGLDLDALVAEGLDPKELRAAKGHGINRPFTKGGASLDAMAEMLNDAGYPVQNEKGDYDKNKLLDLITKELRTGSRVTAQAKNFDMELEDLSKKYDQPAKDLDIPDDLTGMTDEELSALSRRIDEMSAKLDEAEAKVEATRERKSIQDEPMFQRDKSAKDRVDEEKERRAEKNLLIQHNLTAANLLHSVKMGGIPIPSLAITKKDQGLTNFGEITLLGPVQMADPRGYARTRVFGADVYSPRYPSVSYSVSSKAVDRLSALIAPHAKRLGHREFIGGDELKDGPRELENTAAVMDMFLASKGITVKVDPKEEQSYVATEALRKRIRTEGMEEEFSDYVSELFASLSPAERLFQGFTYSGNRRYKPHTLANVMAMLKKELRGGEGFNYGVGSLRSKFTPQFSSLKQISENQDRLLTEEEFKAVKEQIDTEFWEVAGKLAPYSGRGKEFGWGDTVIHIMEDAAKMGIGRALNEYSIEDVSDDVQNDMREFMGKLRTLPTEYFEAKIMREVDLAEFAHAVAPKGTSQKALDALAARGVKVTFYKKGDDADRRRAIQQAAESSSNVLFKKGEAPPAGARTLTSRDIRDEVNRILKEFKTRPRLLVVDNGNQFPPDLLAQMKGGRSDPNEVHAVQWNGGIYINASKYTNLEDVFDTVMHETVVHFGLRSVLDIDTHTAILDGIAASQPMAVRRMGQLEYGSKFNWENLQQRRIAAEEVLAYYAPLYLKNKPVPGALKQWLKQFIDAIKAFIARVRGTKPDTMVLPDDFDKKAMNNIIDSLHDYLKGGKQPDYVETAEQAMAQKPAPTFYSALTRSAMEAKRTIGTAAEWLNTLRNMPGVKKEEMEWSGLEEWINGLDHRATQAEVVDYLQKNEIEVQDVVKGAEFEGQDTPAQALKRQNDDLVVKISALGFAPSMYDGTSDMFLYRNDVNETYRHVGTNVGRWKDFATGAWAPDAVAKLADELRAVRQEMINVSWKRDRNAATQYDQYTTPGGENYRELLMTLPAQPSPDAGPRGWGDTGGGTYDTVNYHSSHWDEQNILAHVRFDERTDADGKHVLFIQEIQSDWHQAGRKRGYNEPDTMQKYMEAKKRKGQAREEAAAALRRNDYLGFDQVVDAAEAVRSHPDWLQRWHVEDAADVAAIQEYVDAHQEVERFGKMSDVPDAPFKTTWPELAFKRMIRWAAQHDFDRIAWTPGQIQADRYDLSKQVGSVIATRERSDTVWLEIRKPNGALIDRGERQMSRLEEMVGQDLARKIEALPVGEARKFTGLDLRVGGEGMIGFYDKILPQTVNKMVKRFGAKVGTTNMSVGEFRGAVSGQMVMEDLGIPEEQRRDYWGGLESVRRSELMNEYRSRAQTRTQPFHSVDVTDSMRASAMEGQPMFQQRHNEEAVERTRPVGEQIAGYKAAAQRAIDAWNHKVGWLWGPLGKLPEKDNYLRLRYRTLGDLTEIRVISRDIFDTLMKSTPEDSQAAYEYLTNREAKADTIQDQKIRATAERVKAMFDVQGQRLVDAGLIPQESFDTYAGQYLPRLYLKHILGDQLHAAMGSGKKMSNLGQTKKRDNTIPEEVRKVILGQIQDPAFLASFGVSRTMRDLAMMDFLSEVSKNEAWTPPEMLVEWNGRRVSPFWMHSEAVRLRKMADFMKGHELAGKARAVADRMDTLANAAIARLERAELDGFKQIPDTPSYGALRGLWVRNEIYEDLVGAANFIDPNSAEAWMRKWSGKITRAWKTSKVALNPPSHFRNMMGNSIMMQLGGVPFRTQPLRMVQAINSLRHKDRFYQVAKKYGMFEATFANVELARIADEWLSLQDTKGSHFGKLNAMAGRVTNAIGDLYQFEEALFKLMKLRHNIEQGMEEGDAMIDAHKWLFDYSLVPRWVRWMRNAPLGVPFLTYTYKAVPRMLEAAILTPHRYLPYIAAVYALKELLEYAFDVDDDDLKKLKQAYPSYMENKGGLMLLPTRDANGNLQLFDMGYIVPWGMAADVARQGEHMEGGMILDSLGIMSGPIADNIAAWKTGIDPFTRKPIVNPSDSTKDQMKQRLWYAWSLAAPPFLTPSGAGGKLYDYATGAVDKRTGEQKLTGGQVAARFFGLTIYPVNPQKSRDTNIYFMQKEIDEMQFRERQLTRDKNLDAAGKAEIHKAFREMVKQKRTELQQYKKDSEVHPNLRNQEIEDKVGALIDGKRKPEAVKALRDAGYPALAGLLEEMPARHRPVVAQALQQMMA